jgi:hypothetical protein
MSGGRSLNSEINPEPSAVQIRLHFNIPLSQTGLLNIIQLFFNGLQSGSTNF